jgi:hypothetical protein
VIVIVIAVLLVLTVTDPKLIADGVAPTPAQAGAGEKTKPRAMIPANRHTSRV